ECCGFLDVAVGRVRLAVGPAQDDVRTADVAGVQPDVVAARVAQCQCVIRARVFADTYFEAAGRGKDAAWQPDLTACSPVVLWRCRLRRFDLLRARFTRLDPVVQRLPVLRLALRPLDQPGQPDRRAFSLPGLRIELRRVLRE